MIAKLLFATAACCIALATPVSRVTETTLPLADERASAFYFVGDIALAVDYEGGGKVTGRINAYDVSKPAFVWRQEVRVQETDKNPGNWIMTQASLSATSARPTRAANPKNANAMSLTFWGSALCWPTSRTGPTRSASVPRMPSE